MARQKLLTKEIINRMPGPREQDGKGEDAVVHLKLFDPYGSGTWLITEAWQIVVDKEGNDRDEPLKYKIKEGETVADVHLYGYCSLFPGTWEWGPVSLKEIESANCIERERWESNGKYTVKQLVR